MLINRLNKIGILLIFISIVIYIIASLYQPLVGDDYNIKYEVLNSENFTNYFINRYMTWSGRFFQNFSSYYIFTNQVLITLIKLINIPIFIITIWLGWYCATNEFINFKKENLGKFICFTSLVWISTPSIAENIYWLTGSITWLYPLFFGMLYLTIFFSEYYKSENTIFTIKYLVKTFTIIISGFISGSSIEQLSLIIFIISSYILLILFRNKKPIPIFIYLGYISLILGILFLLFAPGNYQRLSILYDDNLIKNIIKYLLYVLSSYHSLGFETAGKLFFLSIISLVFIFNPTLKFKLQTFKFSLIWFLASFASIIIMFPVINFVSTRTTFYAVIFFFLFILSINYIKNEFSNELLEKIKNTTLIFIFASLLLIDSFVGLLTNTSLYQENQIRIKKIDNAILNKEVEVEVPFFSIMPSRLTHMHNPKNDKVFLESLSKIKGIKIVHEFKKNSPLPNSKNILKEIKNLNLKFFQ